MLSGRLKKNDRALRKWARREDLECFRVFDRDIPEIPVAIDRFADHLVIQVYDSERVHADLTAALVAAAAATLDVDEANVHVKQRGVGAGAQYEKIADLGVRLQVREAGLNFLVNLDDYLDTGLFLDHRNTRARVRAEAEGKRVLNLFAYTGAFSVYAAAGGAKTVTTVDLSRRYLLWAEDNLRLNDLLDETRHRTIRADVRAFLADAPRRGEAYDLVVLDPPTRSLSKRMDGDFEIQRDHKSLLADVCAVLAPQGVLYFSTNFKAFDLDASAFEGCSVEEVSRDSVPRDFARSLPHRCWRAVRDAS